MINPIEYKPLQSTKLMREAYCETLISAAEKDERIVVLDADLIGSSGMKPFFKKFPERAIQCGIAEANMLGVAAGLSLTGKIPFAHSFAPFVTRRACDQLFVSGAYAKLNIRVLGSDPGITAAYNGGTHMPFEDMAILRAIPDITLLEPCDPTAVSELTRQLAEDGLYGIYYIRMARKNSAAIYTEGEKFTIGKGKILSEGNDVTLFASGIMVTEALSAAAILASEGISARVVDLFTWKPADAELIKESAAKTRAFVTCENHNIYGGLGSAIAEVTARNCPVPIEFVGVEDRFGQVGQESYLRGEYALTAEHIVSAAKKAIARKA
ncbi:MAG: transketolase family protein [Oscillospiraceae bacterium]|jgi:transketolase|nr:transketolase family protein [Oscillospiraceae bacterium]